MNFIKVSVCVPSCDESFDGLTTSSVNVCRQTKQTGISNKADKNSPTQRPELTLEALRTKDSEQIQYNRNISLHQACEEGKLDVVKYILSQGLEDINCQGKLKRTPVMVAARKGHFNVFDYLVSQCCDLSVVDDGNNNVLHVACMGGNVDIVRKLIVGEKLDIESRGNYGRSPMMSAAHYAHRDVFELLVEKGCDLKALDNYKYNILHVACVGGNADIVRFILSQNIVSIDSRGALGRTAVMLAAERGIKGVFNFLVKNGCKLTAVDDQGNTILHVACIGGHVGMVTYLMTLGAVKEMVKLKNKYGQTPVHIAGRRGHAVVASLLKGRI